MPVLRGDDPAAIMQAAKHLARGQLVAFPTETVYGLGARADSDTAVSGIFRCKGRPPDHPLIVHVTDAAAAVAFAEELPPVAVRLTRNFWPGPLTVVVRRRSGVGAAAAGKLPTVGLRCPDHPVAQALLHAARDRGVLGVAAPSANRFGRVSPTRASHVVDEFGVELMVLDGGPCREGIESTIVDCTGEFPVLLRPGTLARNALEQVLGEPLQARHAASPRVPGSMASHYAPDARVGLVQTDLITTAVEAAALEFGPRRVGVYSSSPLSPAAGVLYQPMSGNPSQVAHELFAVLRWFDVQGVRQIWVEAPPETTDWDGVRDRLQRASTP